MLGTHSASPALCVYMGGRTREIMGYNHKNQKGRCGSLNVIDPHKLIGSGIIRRCDLIGVGVALLEEMRHCGG